MALTGYYHNELARVDKASIRLREVMDGLSSAFFIGTITVDGIVTYANRTALDAVGLQRKDVLGQLFVDTPWWRYSVESRQQLREAIIKAAQGVSSRFDARFEDINGCVKTTDFSLHPVFDSKGKVSYLVPSGHDVTERRAAERALKMKNACHDALLRAEDENKLLEDVCRLVVEVGGYRMAWVGYAQHDVQKSVKPVACAGEHTELLSEIVITWAEGDARSTGATGECIRTAKTVICQDVDYSRVAASLRSVAHQKGFRGGIALPLLNQNQVFGNLTIASDNVFKVTDEEVLLLQMLAENLAFGINSLRIKQENQRILSAVYKIAEGVSLATGSAFLQKLVLTMTEALGAQVGIITHLQAPHLDYTRTVAAVVDGQLIDNFDIPMAGTPCEQLSELNPECVVTSEVKKHYPEANGLVALGAEAYIGRRIVDSKGQAMGQIFVLFRQPLTQTEFASSILKIYSARVAAELERKEFI